MKQLLLRILITLSPFWLIGLIVLALNVPVVGYILQTVLTILFVIIVIYFMWDLSGDILE